MNIFIENFKEWNYGTELLQIDTQARVLRDYTNPPPFKGFDVVSYCRTKNTLTVSQVNKRKVKSTMKKKSRKINRKKK